MCLHGRVQLTGRILLDIIESNHFSLCNVAIHSQLVPGGPLGATCTVPLELHINVHYCPGFHLSTE